jgi:hypothetical protein
LCHDWRFFFSEPITDQPADYRACGGANRDTGGTVVVRVTISANFRTDGGTNTTTYDRADQGTQSHAVTLFLRHAAGTDANA